MKVAVAILALVAAASAQFNDGQYNPYNPNRYFVSSTPAPFRYKPAPSVTVTPAPFFASTPAPFFASTPAPFYASTPRPIPVATRIAGDAYAANAQILRFDNEVGPDGSYNYAYETSNGIAAQEQGTPRVFSGNPPVAPVVAQGSYAYTSPEGVPVAISYIADEYGFRPVGDVIPTPPPIPPQIARALEYIARTAPRQ